MTEINVWTWTFITNFNEEIEINYENQMSASWFESSDYSVFQLRKYGENRISLFSKEVILLKEYSF